MATRCAPDTLNSGDSMIRRPKLPNLAKSGTVQNPLRFTDILPVRAMKPGVEYQGWKCSDCEQPIAPRQQGLDRPDSSLTIKCPHCGEVQHLTWQGLATLRYEPRKAR